MRASILSHNVYYFVSSSSSTSFHCESVNTSIQCSRSRAVQLFQVYSWSGLSLPLSPVCVSMSVCPYVFLSLWLPRLCAYFASLCSGLSSFTFYSLLLLLPAAGNVRAAAERSLLPTTCFCPLPSRSLPPGREGPLASLSQWSRLREECEEDAFRQVLQTPVDPQPSLDSNAPGAPRGQAESYP